ncbi:23S rRNA (adenine(2503)-C(2))-methyltransferase RlmN [Oscillospiraceae bacterium LTW-04]|nr:23S rRNA (adenine(2503)-C(2))-methyltransferase RlmN [Oscillospiraceae bacterium MB24-C1]
MNAQKTAATKLDILSMLPAELEALVRDMGQPKFRAGQLFGWLHNKLVASFDEMMNLPAAFRAALSERCYITQLDARRCQSASDGTAKYLFKLPDGNTIESVLMRHDYGNSLCISSQVGCYMGCRFCASTIGGKVRNLTASEMLSQIYTVTKLSGERVDSVVMMGIGEPLDNFDNVVRFLELVRDPNGINLSHRHISLSTCGLVDKIDDLAALSYQLTLSVSLHACDNETRDKIMPVNKRYPIEELLAACRRYFAKTGRRISYEYALIAGVNDSPQQAKKLLALLRNQSCHVNLIPVNPVAETGFTRGSRKQAEAFRDILTAGGLSATIRRELGSEIDAACGQLRRKDAKGGDAQCG